MLYGIIDMGSNSVRLSIFRAENGVITQVIGKKVMAGLAGYVKKGRLTQAGIERACMALEALREILDNFNVDGAGIFATASLRNICNQDEVLNQMERVTGITPEIITGKEEARLDFIGATRFYPMEQGLLADIGGGSTEHVPEAVISESDLVDGKSDIMSLLVLSGLCASRSDARRNIQQGGVLCGEEKVTDIAKAFDGEELRKGVVLRRGKKNFKRVILK